MEAVQEEVIRPRVRAGTPMTDAARFTVTPVDVGSEVVRAGHMAELEEKKELLLLVAKLVLQRIQHGGIAIGAAYEFALKAAIKQADR